MFVVIEGIDSSGKTTLIKALKKNLKEALKKTALENCLAPNIFKIPEILSNVFFTSEPYGPLGAEKKFKHLSNIIFSDEYSISPMTESLLFLAIRIEHILKYVAPKLKDKDSLVICDRYYLSTLAYQAYLKEVDIKWIDYNMNFISKKLKVRPDLIFIIDVSKKDWKNFSKLKKMTGEINKFDSYSYEELVKAYELASNKLKEVGEKIINIPADYTLEEKINFIALAINRKYSSLKSEKFLKAVKKISKKIKNKNG